jgi:hypothetical protein
MHYLLFYEVGADYVSRRAEFRDAHLEKTWAASARGRSDRMSRDPQSSRFWANCRQTLPYKIREEQPVTRAESPKYP